MILLEGGDWNDAFDMAGSRGESVAFSALYAGNLRALADLCRALRGRGISEVSLASELLPLIHAAGGNEEADPDFRTYLAQVGRGISGEKQALGLAELEGRLLEKAERLADRIRTQEWLPDGHGGGWFNGYYDNAGRRLEGREGDRVRMTLAGQVFPLLAGVASDEQARLVVESVDRHLRDETTGGYRLNTDFRDAEFAMGRMTGFAYGHKENGAVFNHMVVMYACALYRRGLAQAGWRVLEGLYQQCQDFARSRMYPGIPEYFNPRGRGMYPYLTGSAAWYLFTLLTEAFGVRGELGDLVLEPMLTTAQFGASDRLSVRTVFAGKRLEIEYRNPGLVDFGDYAIAHVSVNDLQVPIEAAPCRARFARSELDGWPDETRIVIELGKIPRA
jgi:cellobiose phosphorylase